ncbi:MAG: NUDIX hydrolase [Bacteroidota bacterium]|nr:NUDIX hydrolase [Bacteroidota bacterium]
MNRFNQEEFVRLSSRFNEQPYLRDVSLHYSSGNFFNSMKRSIEKDRCGEVVFAVIRPNGKIISVTCPEYPKGIFRIPTGGIRHGEDIIKALLREIKEELGLNVDIISFPGVLKINFEYESDNVLFYSYIFILREKSGKLLDDATDDEVSEVREVDVEGLEQIVKDLGRISGKWGDWGKFRSLTSNAVLEYIRKE